MCDQFEISSGASEFGIDFMVFGIFNNKHPGQICSLSGSQILILLVCQNMLVEFNLLLLLLFKF